MSRTPHGVRAGRKLRRFRPTVQGLENRQLLALTIADPGFESSLDGASNNYGFYYNPAGTPWTFNGVAGFIKGANYGTTPQGRQAALLQRDSSISQVVPGWEAGSYQVSFAAAQRNSSNQDFQVLIDGSVVGLFQPSSTSYHYYTTPSFTVAAGNHTLAFRGLNGVGGDNTVFLDDVAAIPAAPGVPVVDDPSFEMVSVGTGGYAYNPSGSYWQFSPSAGLTGAQSAFTSQNHTAAPDGTQVAFLQYSGSLIQTVTDWSSGIYQVSFASAQRAATNTGGQDFQVLLDDQVIGTFKPTSTTYQTYTTPDFAVTAGQHVLGFRGLNTAGGDNTAFIDQVMVNKVDSLDAVGTLTDYYLFATTVGASTIKLDWSLADFATEYTLERSTDGLSDWTDVAQLGQNIFSFVDTNLSEGATYYYQLVASGDDGVSLHSTIASAVTSLEMPTGLVAVVLSPSQTVVSWQDNSGAESAYIIEESSDGFSNWSQVGSTNSNQTIYSVPGTFAAGTSYYFRIHAISNTNASSQLATAAAQAPPLPASPIITSVTPLAPTAVALNWIAASGADGYRVEHSSDNGSSWSNAGFVAADRTTFTDANLQSASRYSFRIVALNAFGESAPSNTQAVDTRSLAPTELFASASGASSILLYWSVVTGATGYSLERSNDGLAGWSVIATSTPGTTSFADANLPTNTAFSYRVRATSLGGDSDYSPTTTAVTTGSDSILNVVSIVAINPQAAESGQVPAVFRVTHTGDISFPLTVTLTLGGTATLGTDAGYSVSGIRRVGEVSPFFSFAFAIGQSYQDITVTPYEDTVPEPNQTVTLTLSPVQGGFAIDSRSSATAVITDDRAAVNVVSIVATDAEGSFANQDPITFRVSRTGSLTKSLSVNLGAGGSTHDYNYLGMTAPSSLTNYRYVTIAAGSSYQDITINPSSNTQPGPDQSVVLSLTPSLTEAQAYQIASNSSASAVISGSSPTSIGSVVSISALDGQAAELGGEQATFRISRSGSLTAALKIYLNVSGTATNATDYLASPALQGSDDYYNTPSGYMVTIPAGSDHQDVTITPIDDITPEGDETVVLSLVDHSGAYGIGTATATAIIADDRAAINVVTIQTTDPNAAQVGQDSGTFRVSRSGSLTQPLTVYLQIGGTAPESLYTIGPTLSFASDFFYDWVVTIPGGSDHQDIVVKPTTDHPIQGNASIAFSLIAYSNNQYSLTDIATATVIITGALPSPPANLAVVLVSSSHANLSWSDSTGEKGYYVERSINASSSWTRIGLVGADVNSYSDTGLVDGTRYSYRVIAFNESGLSNYSNVAGISVPLAPPSNLGVSFINRSRIDLTWADQSSTATAYNVQQSLDGSTNWTSVANGASTATSASILAVFTPSTPYFFRVQATSTTVGSGSSIFVTGSITTPAFSAAPADIKLTQKSSGTDPELAVSWSSVPGSVSYSVERNLSLRSDGWAQIANVTNGDTAYLDTGLTEGTIYYYRVLANNGLGYSPDSAVVSQTARLVPTIVVPATAGAVTGKSVVLTGLGSTPSGEQRLIYTWSVVSQPAGVSSPIFSANNTNASKRTVATFSAVGTYVFRLTISDGLLSATSDVTVSVVQTLSNITISPANVYVHPNATQQFTARQFDQFGKPMANATPITWSLPPGSQGTMSADGIYRAPAQANAETPVQINAATSDDSASTTAVITDRDILDFEDAADLFEVKTRYRDSGVDFQGATILTEKRSLNEPLYEARSGIKVVYNSSPSIRVDAHHGAWSVVGGYITANTVVKLTAYDADGKKLGEKSTPGANYAGSGTHLERFPIDHHS